VVHLYNSSEGYGIYSIAAKQYLGGKTGLGVLYPDYRLEVDGSAGKPGGGSWSDSCDERLKKNIAGIDGKEALDKICRLRGVTFEWINPEEHSEGVRAGVIAQELEEVFPGWVEEIYVHGADSDLIPEGEKSKSVSFPHDFNAYVVEAIKELKAESESLRVENETLRQRIAKLEASK